MRWRYRPFQAAALGFLATLVVACAVFTPAYDREVRQAVARTAVARTDPAVAGLRLTGTPRDSGGFGRTSVDRPMPPEELAAVLPASARASYAAPVLGWAAAAAVIPGGRTDPVGEVRWRSDQCDHVRLVSGACPSRPGDVLVSRDDRRLFGYAPGTRLRIEATPTATLVPQDRSIGVRVTGVYEQEPGPYWFGARLTGRAGYPDQATGHVQHDVWLAAPTTFQAPRPPLPTRSSTADFALRTDRAGVDVVLSLAAMIQRLDTAGTQGLAGGLVDVYSGMPTIADDVREQSQQSRVTVPLLMAQLGVLLVVVLWLVLSAVSEQRRPEVALARLRGRGRRGALGLVLGELLPVVLAGVVPGVLLALGGALAVRRWLLPGDVPLELRLPLLLALALAVAVLVVATVLAVARVTREPVVALLRRVPPRRTGWAIGAVDAVLLAAALAVAVVFVVGGIRGPVALVAPGILAVAVGLVLAHLVPPVTAAAGRAALRRGRVRAATAFLEAARSPATRRVVVMVTLATALAVFSADGLRIGQRNWDAAAAQEAGAPAVLHVDGSDLPGLRAALAGLAAAPGLPGGADVTPVVRVEPPGTGTSTTLAVVPEEFRRVALFGAERPSAADWQRLAPPAAAPIELRGTVLRADLRDSSLVSRRLDGEPNAVTVGVDLLTPRGEALHATLGELDRPADRARLTTDVQCSAGCTLTGIWFGTLPGATIDGRVTIAGLTTAGTGAGTGSGAGSVRIGPASRWTPLHDPGTGSIVPRSDRPDRLALEVHGAGSNRVTIRSAWIPPRLATIVAGGHGAASPLTLAGLDGDVQAGVRVATLPRVPGADGPTDVVGLDAAQRGRPLGATASLEVWSSSDDPAVLAAVGAALEDRGLRVTATTTLHGVRQDLGWTAAAWSLQLAVLVGGAALLVALLVLVVSAASSWRARTRDLAALRMSGVPVRELRRMPVLAQLLGVLVGVVAGTLTGWYGAQLALPMVPLFAAGTAATPLDLDTAWVAVAVAGLAALVVLGVAALLIGRRLGSRADLGLLREVV